jgi:hypothetical protein
MISVGGVNEPIPRLEVLPDRGDVSIVNWSFSS